MGGVRLLALDGASTIGGSKLLLSYDSTNVMLDFGTNFHSMSTYYEEYLKPRTTGGLLDYIVMGVLPDARNIYREDLIHPELKLRSREIGGIDALLLSHAHADHFGDLGFLRLDVPVVTDAMSATIVKAIADSGKADLGKDHVFPSPRKEETSRGTIILKSCSGKEVDALGTKGRDFVMSGGIVPKSLNEFWDFSPSIAMADNAKRCKPRISGALLSRIDNVKFRSYPVDHSVKGASAFVIPTSQGNVVYAGDIRTHGIKSHLTKEFVNAAKSPRPHVLLIEGTRIGRSSNSSSDVETTTETNVLDNVRGLMSEMEGDFAIADFGARNIERLEIFLRVAIENHRKMVVTTKDAYLLYAMHLVDASVPVPGSDILVYDCPKGSEHKYEEYVLDKVYPGAVIKAEGIAKSPGDYLMALSFFDLKHLVDIRPCGGHYMYSSSEAFSEEQKIDFVRMGAWQRKFGLKPLGIGYDKDWQPIFTKGPSSLHASGHASPSDIVEIVRGLDPEIIVPVHTEHAEWFVEMFGGERNVVIPDEQAWTEL